MLMPGAVRERTEEPPILGWLRRRADIAAVTLIVLIALSLPAPWRYVVFMKREHSAYLKVPFDYLYSIYLIFAVVCILRQARIGWLAWRGLRRGEEATRS